MAITIPNRKNIRLVTDFDEANNGHALPAATASVAMTNPGPVMIDSGGVDARGQAQVKPAYGASGRSGYCGYNPDPSIGLGAAVSAVRQVIIDGFAGVVAGSPVFIDDTSADNSATASGLTQTAPTSGTSVSNPQVDLAVSVAATTSFEVIVPVAGTITELDFLVSTTVTADDTNYWTFAVVNKSNSNAAVLANTAANTTKATGGSTLTGYTPKSETLSSTGANLVVSAGDVLEITATKTASATALAEFSARIQITSTGVAAQRIGLGWTTTKILFD